MNTTTPATPRQTFALFCATGKDWRKSNPTAEQASAMLAAIMPLRGNKPAALDVASRIFGGEPVDTSALPATTSYASIYDEAHKAGLAAVAASRPVPMLIPGYAPVMGGVCGFAWVHFPDGRKPFGKWLVKNGKGRKDGYRGGVTVNAGFSIGGQSMEIKEDYCCAFAKVCNDHGIDCRPMSRID